MSGTAAGSSSSSSEGAPQCQPCEPAEPQPVSSKFRLLASCPLPTEEGDVTLHIFGDGTGAPWSVCVYGDVLGKGSVPTRLHDACMTSEVLGSVKCDCARQLRLAQRQLAASSGLLIYSPQEGRGIGLAAKIAAYALQAHKGLDTVDANRALGLPDEARSYEAVPVILRHLQVSSIRLLTNNPFKLSSLRALGVTIATSQPLAAREDELSDFCRYYLSTKARRMGHTLAATPPAALRPLGAASGGAAPPPFQLAAKVPLAESPALGTRAQLRPPPPPPPPLVLGAADGAGPSAAPRVPPPSVGERAMLAALLRQMGKHAAGQAAALEPTPFVTLTYAQSLDGSVAGPLGAAGPRLMLSSDGSMRMTHRLRAAHDAIVVGAGTLKADDPQLTVRLVPGASPLRVVLDSHVRMPADCKMLQSSARPGAPSPGVVVVAARRALCDAAVAARAAALRAAGVRVLAVDSDGGGDGGLRIAAALRLLRGRCGVRRVMVEGGAGVIGSCVRERLAHRAVLTIAPTLVGGLRPAYAPSDAEAAAAAAPLRLSAVQTYALGDDVVVSGALC